MIETIPRILSGKWQDKYYKDGKLVHDTGVQCNQIQDNAYVVVASLLANQFDIARVPVETPTTFGISYIDYGSGDPTWDLPNTVVNQPTSDTQIHNAVYRQEISQDQITFVPVGDPFGGNAISVTPTNRIRVNLILTELEPIPNNGEIELREFGLFCRFGDDANNQAAVNQGLIFNWVVHPLIDKDNSLRLERVVEITIENCN